MKHIHKARTGSDCAQPDFQSVQMLLTDGLIYVLRITPEQTFLRFLIYGFVMCFLFFFSFLIQQRWVFAKKEEK